MSDIQSLIQKLQSDNPDKRYDACKELRVMASDQPLPQEAIDALRITANDTIPYIADIANATLMIHTLPKSTPAESNMRSLENPNDRQRESPGIGNYLTIGLFMGLITNPITSIIIWGGIGPLDAAVYVFICAPIVGAFFGATGGLIGGLLKGNKIGAVIGGIIISAISGLFPDFWYWFFFVLLL